MARDEACIGRVGVLSVATRGAEGPGDQAEGEDEPKADEKA